MFVEILVMVLLVVLIEITLGADNAIIVATVTNHMESEQKRKLVTWIGISLALSLRLVLIITFIFLETMGDEGEGLPFVGLFGGLILLGLSTKLVKKEDHNKLLHKKRKGKTGQDAIWLIVVTILVADFSTSLDNAISVSAMLSTGDFDKRWIEFIIAFVGLCILFPIFVWGTRFLEKMTMKYEWINYAAMGFLLFIAFELIVTDSWYWNEPISDLWVYVCGALFAVSIARTTWMIKHPHEKKPFSFPN